MQVHHLLVTISNNPCAVAVYLSESIYLVIPGVVLAYSEARLTGVHNREQEREALADTCSVVLSSRSKCCTVLITFNFLSSRDMDRVY